MNIKSFTKKELRLLADGMHPKYVREGLECETVIVSLSRFAVAVGTIVEQLQEERWERVDSEEVENV